MWTMVRYASHYMCGFTRSFLPRYVELVICLSIVTLHVAYGWLVTALLRASSNLIVTECFLHITNRRGREAFTTATAVSAYVHVRHHRVLQPFRRTWSLCLAASSLWTTQQLNLSISKLAPTNAALPNTLSNKMGLLV